MPSRYSGGRRGDYGLVDPLDHVNLSQSTNDVFPTALKVAAIRLVLELAGEIALLQGSFQAKEEEFTHILKLGRTEMQDAVPITLGQEFGAFAEAMARDRWRLFKVEERLRQVNLGGTAVGTGINAERAYIYAAIEELQDITGLGVSRSENSVDVTQNADVFVEASGLVKAAAVNLAKISGRLEAPVGRAPGRDRRDPSQAASGGLFHHAGQGEPGNGRDDDAGRLPGDVFRPGHCHGSGLGQLELNAFLPLIAFNLLTGIAHALPVRLAFPHAMHRGDRGRCRAMPPLAGREPHPRHGARPLRGVRAGRRAVETGGEGRKERAGGGSPGGPLYGRGSSMSSSPRRK